MLKFSLLHHNLICLTDKRSHHLHQLRQGQLMTDKFVVNITKDGKPFWKLQLPHKKYIKPSNFFLLLSQRTVIFEVSKVNGLHTFERSFLIRY